MEHAQSAWLSLGPTLVHPFWRNLIPDRIIGACWSDFGKLDLLFNLTVSSLHHLVTFSSLSPLTLSLQGPQPENGVPGGLHHAAGGH